MKLAQRARSCPACGRREPVDAQWCGDCGAPLGGRAGPTVLRLDEAPPASEPERSRRGGLRRAAGGVAAAVLVVTVAGVLAEPTVVGDPDLLGRIDESSGRSSLLPPFDDLQPLWRRPVELGGAIGEPPSVRLPSTGVVVDGQVPSGTVRWSADVAPSSGGTVLLVDGDEVVVADAATAAVVGRRPLAGAGSWRPVGQALGWVAGAAVLASPEGVLGAVEVDGRVRWVGDASWAWDGTGDGSDWLVVTVAGTAVDRAVVVDGRDGAVARDLGPAGAVHAAVVHGDTVVWVDPFGGRDLGLGQPVEVHGLRLDGSGRVWAVTDLPPTTGELPAVTTTAVDDGVVVHYWSAGQSTTAVWLDPRTGARLGEVVVAGSGTTEDGWPVVAVTTDGIAHVSPLRRELRFVDRGGRVRWSEPARAGEGVVAAGADLLVRTPYWRTPLVGDDTPRGSLLQTRLRLVDAISGVPHWDVARDDVGRRRLVAVLAGHVGVSDVTVPVPLRDQVWLELDTGRRSAGAGLLARELDGVDAALADAMLLGRVRVGPSVRPVVALQDGRFLGIDPTDVVPTLAELLSPGGSGWQPATVLDDRTAVQVGAASVTATMAGRLAWRSTPQVVLDPDAAVLTGALVVVAGRDGVLRAWDRDDGALAWVHDRDTVTAVTAGGDELVVGTFDGRVLVLDDAGTVLQDVRAGRAPVDDLAVVDGQVVVTTGADVVGLGRGAFFVEPGDRVDLP